MNQKSHKSEIIDQFSKQAIPFARLAGHRDGMQMILEFSGVNKNDIVLDVACGPGLVSCEFARTAKHVTGIDITQKMIAQAVNLQKEKNLGNLTWINSDAIPLPFPDESFTLVVSRYSFHHFPETRRNLEEMIRVCCRDGRILVADVSVPEDKSEAYDRMERMRDPSHMHALAHDEFADMFMNSGLKGCRQASYQVDMELEAQLKASFPSPGDDARLRKMIADDIGFDRIGVNAREEDGKVIFTYPISIFMGEKLI
ncbi:MAG TPA: methyltransferase type 11 [Lentisphaeria bacterium]|nr:MAG: methyltransferase type 11 [Lentisphaerae bacterium GWF2_50_93]HCE44731.1 methyltransferase type 11 [Lentisphaeria bacterium]